MIILQSNYLFAEKYLAFLFSYFLLRMLLLHSFTHLLKYRCKSFSGARLPSVSMGLTLWLGSHRSQDIDPLSPRGQWAGPGQRESNNLTVNSWLPLATSSLEQNECAGQWAYVQFYQAIANSFSWPAAVMRVPIASDTWQHWIDQNFNLCQCSRYKISLWDFNSHFPNDKKIFFIYY